MKRVWMTVLGTMVLACGSQEATVPVAVRFPLTKSIISSLSRAVLTVSANDMTTITSTQDSPFGSTVSFSVNVPTGNNRSFACTASVSGSTSTGYQGSTTSNITSEGGSVPLTMLYVNFANNSTAAVGSGPQITSITTAYSATEVTLTVGFGSTLTAQTTAFIIEFVPSAGGTARSQSIINQAKGSVDVTMASAGTKYIIVNGTGANTYSPILYNASDESQTLTVAELSATADGTAAVDITMTRTAFTNNIDSSIVGTLNVLAGSKDSGATIITPTNLSSLTASSAAVNTSGGNAMKYNASFDTSSL